MTDDLLQKVQQERNRLKTDPIFAIQFYSELHKKLDKDYQRLCEMLKKNQKDLDEVIVKLQATNINMTASLAFLNTCYPLPKDFVAPPKYE